jgi:hypothetical protein
MPRTARVALGGVIFHVLNRANARSRIFEKDQDYEVVQAGDWRNGKEGTGQNFGV